MDLVPRPVPRPLAAGPPQARRFAKAHGATARDVMSAELVTAEETTPAEEIARLMERHNIRRVPVLREGRLAGLVSRADLLRALLRPPGQAPEALTDDAEILRAVITRMRTQPWTDTFWVYPHVEDGVVTLYGYARSDAMRDGLRVLAGEVPGVTSVQDRMEPMPLVLRAMP
jgi:CBS domain/BON domain